MLGMFTSTSDQIITSVDLTIIIDNSYQPRSPHVATPTDCNAAGSVDAVTSPVPSSTASFATTQGMLGFAGVVVRPFCRSNLGDMVQARVMIQTSFNGPAIGSRTADVKLQNGNSIDFVGFAVDAGSGRLVRRRRLRGSDEAVRVWRRE
jgi:hypothetical protein